MNAPDPARPRKHSVTVSGHRTSLTLEPPGWEWVENLQGAWFGTGSTTELLASVALLASVVLLVSSIALAAGAPAVLPLADQLLDLGFRILRRIQHRRPAGNRQSDNRVATGRLYTENLCG